MPVHERFVDSLEEVAGLALGKVGERKSIVNLQTDTGSAVETVRRFIFQVIREVQSEFRWGELTASVELESPIAENDDTYQYTLPSDYLRPASNRDQEYVIENGYLFTSVSENFPFRYIRYSENPEEWSGLLVKCVYFRLALEICMPITENVQKYNSLLQEYETVVFPRAKMVGSFDTENPRPRIARGRYSRTRGGLAGGLVGAFNRVIGVIAPGHNHDVDYSAIDHDHDADYAALVHDHDDLYPTLAVFNAHDHDANYAAIDHLHTGVYSPVGHGHADIMGYIMGYTMKYSGTQVFSGNMPTTLTDLDLSAQVGANRAFVYLHILKSSANARIIDFQEGGFNVNHTKGGSSLTLTNGEGGVVSVLTGSDGKLKWKGAAAEAVTISLRCYQILQGAE